MLAVLRTAVLVCGLVAAAPPAHGPGQLPAREVLEQRWSALPPAERARLSQHLDELERLTPAERRALLERARALRDREQDLEHSAELRERLAGLAPEARRELWQAQVREHFRAYGRELRARLPDDVRAELEHAPPEQRRRMLERLGKERERVSRRALADLGQRLDLTPREMRRLERMSSSQRLRELRELRTERTPGVPRPR